MAAFFIVEPPPMEKVIHISIYVYFGLMGIASPLYEWFMCGDMNLLLRILYI